MLAPLLHASHAQQYQHERQHQSKDAIDVRIMPILEPMPDKSMDDFLAEVRDSFGMPMQAKRLHAMSKELQGEYREKLKASSICMLPSFHHTLPTGREQGTILALDVGGSTFRVALVNLTGKTSSNGCESRSQNGLQEERPEDDNGGMEIKRIRAFAIDNNVRALCGSLFFDWMAQRIEEVLAESPAPSPTTTTNSLDFQPTPPLPMALAWSFPIEQTSTKRGLLLPMGKGFYATQGVEGSDIYTLVSEACAARSLNVQLTAIVNDSSATLLSQAYRDPSTRISLIMGTGINSAVYLPVNILEKEKFGAREEAWWQDARHVLVNTELSMFGKNVWPASRWDDHLNQAHNMPDFQPLEYKAGGRFLGEIVRLVLVEGVETAGLFHGEMPVGLDQPYALDTGVIAAFEGDETPALCTALAAFRAAHPLPSGKAPTLADLTFVKEISTLVSTRAAAYTATAVHSLWSLQRDAAAACPSCADEPLLSNQHGQGQDREKSATGTFKREVDTFHNTKATIACNGSIMEKYPTFRNRCQAYLDDLTHLSTVGINGDKATTRKSTVTIEMAVESSVFGAAVAAAAEAVGDESLDVALVAPVG